MIRTPDTVMNETELSLPDSRRQPGAARTGWRPSGLVVFVVVGVLLGGCSTRQESEQVPTVTVQVAAAEKEAIHRDVNVDSILYPRDQAAIVPKVTAPIRKFYVNRGSRVRAGQLLAELENQDLVGALTESQGGYQQADASYQGALQKAQQDLKLAKEVLDAQQRLYEGRVRLFEQGAASARDVDDARISLTQARNQYDLAQKQLDLKAAEGQLTSAKGRSAAAQAQLSYTKIVSPIDGVVTDRPYYPGETAPGGSPIVTVMDLSQVVARAHVSQQDAAYLKVGNPATISVPDQGAEVPGRVTLVSPALDPNSTTVEVWVEAPNPGNRLKPGASAHLKIVAETVPEAVVVPAAGLLTGTDGVTSMIVLDSENKPGKRVVKVGIRDGDDVQITEGLKAGERVVTLGAFELGNEDPDVLAKTKIQIQVPQAPEEGKQEK
jgi:HlyD family secretion protein